LRRSAELVAGDQMVEFRVPAIIFSSCSIKVSNEAVL
jgi:hypothetical protein